MLRPLATASPGRRRSSSVSVLSIAFGALTFVYPGSGALAIVSVIGLYAVAYGLTLVVAGFTLLGARNHRVPATS